MKNLKCYIHYYLIVLIVASKNPYSFAKIAPSEKIIKQAWEQKDEGFLWQVLSKKYLQDIWKVILFWIVFIYVTVLRPGGDFFSVIMRIFGWAVLYLILVVPPLILLGKFLWKQIIYDAAKPWNLQFSYLLTRLFIKEFEEESRGDLTEARNQLVKQGYTGWLVSFITLIRVFKRCLFFWLCKFQYLANNFSRPDK